MPPPKGSRQARGLARQQQILDVAFTLFATRGFRATSLARIAAALGISEPGVLHHFPNKEALLREVLAKRDAVDVDTEAWLAEPQGGLGSLRRVPVTAQTLVDNPLLARFDAVIAGESLADDGPPPEYFRQRLRLIRDAFALVVRLGIERGEIAADTDPDAIGLEVVAFMDGIQSLWLLDPDRVDIRAAYDRYFAALVERLQVGS